MSCGGVEDFNLHRFLQHQLTIRAPALCTRPNLRLLDPTKRRLRNPTLRDCKTQLACRIEYKTATATSQPPNNMPPHLHNIALSYQATASTIAQPTTYSSIALKQLPHHLLTHPPVCCPITVVNQSAHHLAAHIINGPITNCSSTQPHPPASILIYAQPLSKGCFP